MNISKTPVYLWILLSAVLISVAVVAVIDHAGHHSPQVAHSQPLRPVKSQPADISVGNRIGDTAPDFMLDTIDGRQISLSDYRGKNVMLNFWATWCGPCRLETSTVEAIHEAWSDKDVVVLGVNVQDGLESATSYASANNLKFTIAVDVPGDTIRLYNVRGIPTTFFIDRAGIIKAIKIGPFITTDEVEGMMAAFK